MAKNKELLRTLKYAMFAISAGVIQFVSAMVLKLILEQTSLKGQSMFFIHEFETTTFISDTIGLVLSVLWNCTFNRKYTFKSANNVPVAMCLALLLYVPYYPFYIWYVDVVEKALAGIGFWGFVIALVTAMIINFLLEFPWQRFVVFRKSIDTNAAAQKEKSQQLEQQEDTQTDNATAENQKDNQNQQ